MLEFAHLPLEERQEFFLEAASRRGVSPLIIEKDFWVCLTLGLLFSTPGLDDKFVFKGGTSLSKVFGLIKRFSEDIDLSVDPGWLGFEGELWPDDSRSQSYFEKLSKRLDQTCITRVEGVVQPLLERAIEGVLGPSPHHAYLTYNLDPQTKSPVLIFRYPTAEHGVTGYIRPQIKLEFGSLIDQRPIDDHTVTPWVAEEFPELFSLPTARVVALEAERTFWEKVTILHAEYHRLPEKRMRPRVSRDCYDVCQMAADPIGQRAMQNLTLLTRVAHFKQTFFRAGWVDYTTAKPGSLHLVPPDERLADLRSDYLQMREMFIETPPDFVTLLQQLRELEASLNCQVGAVAGQEPR
jgi:hypothetical protein